MNHLVQEVFNLFRHSKSLPSSTATATLERVFRRYHRRAREHFSWGTDLDSGRNGQRIWCDGCLRGLWLVEPQLLDLVVDDYIHIRHDLERLGIVAAVDVTEYCEVAEQGIVGPTGDVVTGELIGERWRVRFSNFVVYDHTPSQHAWC